jgi:hypothetical protein
MWDSYNAVIVPPHTQISPIVGSTSSEFEDSHWKRNDQALGNAMIEWEEWDCPHAYTVAYPQTVWTDCGLCVTWLRVFVTFQPDSIQHCPTTCHTKNVPPCMYVKSQPPLNQDSVRTWLCLVFCHGSVAESQRSAWQHTCSKNELMKLTCVAVHHHPNYKETGQDIRYRQFRERKKICEIGLKLHEDESVVIWHGSIQSRGEDARTLRPWAFCDINSKNMCAPFYSKGVTMHAPWINFLNTSFHLSSYAVCGILGSGEQTRIESCIIRIP